MEMTTERVGGTLVLVVTGRLHAGNAEALADWGTGQICDADQAVVLDLEHVEYCGSAGLRAVILLARTMERRHARFAVCALQEAVHSAFHVTGFDQVVPLHDSRSAAVAALSGRPAGGD